MRQETVVVIGSYLRYISPGMLESVASNCAAVCIRLIEAYSSLKQLFIP